MIYASDFVLEVTRRCNLRCAHCLRGAVQRVDMSPQTIWNALKNIDEIGILTITGGEPSLKPEIIREIWNVLLSRGIHVGSFYVVTNAKSTYKRIEFLEALDKLYQWCDEPEQCTLCVSQDQFHNNLRSPNMKYFAGNEVDDYGDKYWMDREYFRPNERTTYITNVIDDGRAKELQFGSVKAKLQKPWSVRRDNDDLHVFENEVYISANGKVTSCCDMSYKRIDEECIGNVNDEPLEDIILRNCEFDDDDEDMTGEYTPEQEEINV